MNYLYNCPFHTNTTFQTAQNGNQSIIYDDKLPLNSQLIKNERQFIDLGDPFFAAIREFFKPLRTPSGIVYLSITKQLKSGRSEENDQAYVYYETRYCLRNKQDRLCDKECTHLSSDEIEDYLKNICSLSISLLTQVQEHNSSLSKNCNFVKINDKND